jgi:hypothetical protein
MLFGKNATAGLINIVTNRPDLRNDGLWRVSAFARNLFDEHSSPRSSGRRFSRHRRNPRRATVKCRSSWSRRILRSGIIAANVGVVHTF